MGILDKLFRRSQSDTAVEESPAEETCSHVNLVPRWDNPDQIGKEENASAYTCSSCGAEFSPQEAREHVDSTAGRIVASGESAAAEADEGESGNQ